MAKKKKSLLRRAKFDTKLVLALAGLAASVGIWYVSQSFAYSEFTEYENEPNHFVLSSREDTPGCSGASCHNTTDHKETHQACQRNYICHGNGHSAGIVSGSSVVGNDWVSDPDYNADFNRQPACYDPASAECTIGRFLAYGPYETLKFRPGLGLWTSYFSVKMKSASKETIHPDDKHYVPSSVYMDVTANSGRIKIAQQIVSVATEAREHVSPDPDQRLGYDWYCLPFVINTNSPDPAADYGARWRPLGQYWEIPNTEFRVHVYGGADISGKFRGQVRMVEYRVTPTNPCNPLGLQDNDVINR